MPKLEEFKLPIRAFYALARAGITTTEQVDRMSDADLLAVKGFGKSCLIATLGEDRRTEEDQCRQNPGDVR